MNLSERQFVEQVRQQAARHAPTARGVFTLRQGIGDDCAVLAYSRRQDLLVTTDLFLEGIHFRREWQEPASVGHKVLARGLSDIAAMGGIARYAFLSLAVPRRIAAAWVRNFFRGLFQLAKQTGVRLAGGDTGASRSGVVADIMVIGEVPRNRAVLRSGARPGEEIWVTGRLGNAARGLTALRSGKQPRKSREALQSFCYPQPRLRIGRYLRERELASAMIDLSDGLSLDLARLCEASRTGARIEEAAIPRAPGTSQHFALHGGEDLELLFTVPSERSREVPSSLDGVPITRIGQIISPRKLWLARSGKKYPLPARGFQHF